MTLLLYHGGVPSVIPPPTASLGVPTMFVRELNAAQLAIAEPPEVRLHIRRLDG